MKIGLYSPFFGSTVGGGEKYFGVTAEAIKDAFPEHQVDIITPVPVDVHLYERMLGLNLQGIRFISTNRRITTVHRILNSMPTMRLYRDLFVASQATHSTRGYDLYLAMVYVIPVFSRARRSVMLCQFPYPRGRPHRRLPAPIWSLYSLPYRLLRPMLLGDEVGSFQDIICQSEYVRYWIQRYWSRQARVINPPIDVPLSEPAWDAKEGIILSVGRFFEGGHTKRHDLMIQVFRELCDDGLRGWELHLAGSVHREAHHADYYERVETLARGYPVRLHPDASYQRVQDLYRRAAIYWHAAGYGADAESAPDLLEHFGMTTAEAMGHGVVPVVIASGGQLEVVQDGENGYRWAQPDELKRRTLQLAGSPSLRRQLGMVARGDAHRFAREEFKRRMVAALTPVVRDLETAAQVTPVPEPLRVSS